MHKYSPDDLVWDQNVIRLVSLLLVITMFPVSADESPPPCSAPEHRQFDFWLGHWTSYTEDGKKQGSNRIEKMMGQCMIQGHWISAKGRYRGSSFNFYDPANKQWHQTWVDNNGGSLRMDGGLVGGSMQLAGKPMSAKGENVIDRITWTPMQDGRVRQHWQASSDDGETWADVYDGYTQRDEHPSEP